MQSHIIIGDGVAGMSAAQYIRGKRPKDKIVIVSNDPQPYYYRAALTNYLSKRLKSQELLAMPIDHWAQLRFERVYGSVTRLDHASQSIQLADGQSLSYDRLLIATGCRARRMQTPQNDPKRGVVGADQPGIHVMRTFNDTQRIISDIAPNKRVVVLGGGILGIEACHGLHHRGMKVTLVHRQPWLLDKVVDKRAGSLIAGKMRRDGVDVVLGSSIHAVHGSATGGIHEISLNDNHGTKIPCEMVVTCIGNEPNTEWLAGSDIELSRGYIPVNRLMQVSGCKQVWAAGDVAQFADPSQPFPNPSGLWQPARKQGQIAGRDMLRASAIPDRVYAPGAIYNATKAWDLDLSVIGHHADQDKKDGYESVVFDQVTAEGTSYKKIILKQEPNGLRLVGVMLLGDRREGHVLKDLMNLHGDNNWDVSAIKDRIFDPTFDLAAWVAFRKRQPDAKSYQQTGVTSLSPIPISLLNSQMESKQKDLAIATPLKTNMAVATIDASIRLQVEGQSEVLQFKQRGVRIGARQDYDVVVPQKSRTPETLTLSREGFKWVASSDARRRPLVNINGTPLTRPVTMVNGDRIEFLGWKATVVLEDIEAKLAAESAGDVEVRAALIVNGKPFPLRHKYTTIGTSGDNHVILQDPKACFQHAQLHRNNNGAEYILMDVSSTGGTFVNNKQIYGPTKLLPGQTVRMGDSTVVLQMFEKPKRVNKTAIPIRTKEQSIAKPVAKPKAAAVPHSRPKPGKSKTDESLKDSVGNKSAKTVVDGPAGIPIFLTVEFGMNEGQVHEVTLPVTVGRSSKAGVTIRDTLLSREHCKIERTKGGYQITDTNSSNGLRVEGEKLAPGVPMAVKPGDSIELGRSLVKFQTAKQRAESVVADKPVVKEPIEAEEEVIVADLDEVPSPQFNSAVSATSGFGAASASGAPVKQAQLSADSPFQIDLLSSGDSFTMDGEQDFRKKVFDELDACIGCHECMNACPLEETRSIDNSITIAQLNSYAMGSGAAVEVTNDFIDKCTQCHACVPVCPVDIHRSRIVLWNKLKKGPTPDKKIHVQQMRGGQMDSFESTITARKLANEFEDHPILGCLGETEKIRLFSEASFRQLSNGETLFREGSYLDSVWFVLDGALETGMATANAEFQTMVLLTAGQCVGEDSVMADQPSEVGVRGAAPSTVVMGLSKYSLKSIMKTPGQGPKEFRQRMEHMYANRSIEAFFNKQPAFQGMGQAVVQQIIQEFSAERYLPGNLILSDSEAESRIGIVKRGFVKEVRLRDGREVVANYLQVGDAFGGIQTDKQGAAGVFNRRGQLVRYEAGTAAEVLTSDLSQLGRKFPAFASLLDSSWRTDQFGGGSEDVCPVGHDGIDLGDVTDVLHATKLLVINTATCVDCDNCVSACQRRHGHARIDRRGSGRQIGQFQVPASCFHCEDPVCLLCGVDGIVREPTGEIRITDNCIGCRQCAERCPYDNIQMVPREDNRSFLEKWLPKPLGNLLGFEEPDVGRMSDGEIVATKCDLCHGYDGLPACVRSCPTGAAQRVDPLEHFLNK